IFSGLGLLVLFGVVKKNSILQIDHANQLRESGMNTHDAVIQASRDRLRPILMTTLAMIFGMVPLAFALTEGSEQRAPMGQAVIGGVITSSLLTLVVVPVTYCYLDDLAQWFKRCFAARPAQPAAAVPPR
ncbi:MAG: efflux RND transporter permease subunit, partial [Pseudomonadota bacterium]|nr:efflux RND transporter permease subunit [Pseudomonadota bacterium]